MRQLRRKFERSAGGEAGFTLVEMLVVITIIGLIMGLVGPRVLNYLSESKVKAAKIQMQSFSSALDLFNLDTGRYPASGEGLGALIQSPGTIPAWNGPYLKAACCQTIRGEAICLSFAREHGPYDIVSYGPTVRRAVPEPPPISRAGSAEARPASAVSRSSKSFAFWRSSRSSPPFCCRIFRAAPRARGSKPMRCRSARCSRETSAAIRRRVA